MNHSFLNEGEKKREMPHYAPEFQIEVRTNNYCPNCMYYTIRKFIEKSYYKKYIFYTNFIIYNI